MPSDLRHWRSNGILMSQWEIRSSTPYGLEGLTGSSLLVKAHTAPPTIRPPPIPMATGLLRMPPLAPAAGSTPAAPFFFFLLLLFCAWESSCDEDSSWVVCCPCARVEVPLESLMVRSPLRAAISTLPSTSLTSNSVHTLARGVMVTPPARVASSFEVEIVTPPCSNLIAPPSY